MPEKKKQLVPVEIKHVVFYWTCTNCKKDNGEEFEDFDLVQELECECGAILERQGEIHWAVKQLQPGRGF